MKPRIIVCGLGRTGYQIFCLLEQQGASVVGISSKPIADRGEEIVIGDLSQRNTLLAAGITESHTLVIATHDDALNLAILMQARILNPNINVINRLFNISLGDRLDSTLPGHTTMSVSSLAAPLFAFAAMGNRAIGQLRLLNQTWPIYEEYIDELHPWKGLKISEMWDNPSRMMIYYLPADRSIDLVSAVLHGKSLEVGDRLILAAQPNRRKKVRHSLPQKLRKTFRQWQRVHEQSWSTILVILTLFLTIFVATITYTWINIETSFVDSIYFSVGMITGAGGNEKVVEEAPASIKVFTALMMLIGAGVIGICYALLNDFVLGTRFTKLFNKLPIPEGHHYIICGLGGIGIQTARHLQEHGYEVVAIDRDPNCRFLSTAQALKIPVIQGDANLPETLRAANVDHAEAIVAVTSDDTMNLEIALTAKALAAKLPLVVRNLDPKFALMVKQVFDFEAVFSPIELAAPAFAAAALGGRICGNGMTAGSLWVALAMLITPAHPFAGEMVKDAAMKADFVPLYIESHGQKIHGWDLLDFLLTSGDILYLTMPANRLSQLWQITRSQLIAS